VAITLSTSTTLTIDSTSHQPRAQPSIIIASSLLAAAGANGCVSIVVGAS
jgi:hypothetical protein